MNSPFTFVVAIVAIVTIGNIIKTAMTRRDAMAERSGETEELVAKIDVLEDRVKVLERIVTEHNFDLKQQIDNL